MTNWPNNEPVYFVVVETVPRMDGYVIYAILRVVECDFADVQMMYETHVSPLYAQGRHVQSMVFRREPPNPFRDAKETQSESISH